MSLLCEGSCATDDAYGGQALAAGKEPYHSLFLDRDFLADVCGTLRILVMETTNICNADCVF